MVVCDLLALLHFHLLLISNKTQGKKKHSDGPSESACVCLCVCVRRRGKTALTRRLSSVLLQDIVSQEQGMSKRDRGTERGRRSERAMNGVR